MIRWSLVSEVIGKTIPWALKKLAAQAATLCPATSSPSQREGRPRAETIRPFFATADPCIDRRLLLSRRYQKRCRVSEALGAFRGLTSRSREGGGPSVANEANEANEVREPSLGVSEANETNEREPPLKKGSQSSRSHHARA
jgi:hypothetical protein